MGLRDMSLVATHLKDPRRKMKSGELPGVVDYDFSVRNTNKASKSLGTARNIHLDVDLPKAAKLQDASFYLEGNNPKEVPSSQSCKLHHDTNTANAQVNCFLSHVHSIVDVHIRASYEGDQKALHALTGQVLDGTLHEGHEVLKTT